jgi:hypothetical protein
VSEHGYVRGLSVGLVPRDLPVEFQAGPFFVLDFFVVSGVLNIYNQGEGVFA